MFGMLDQGFTLIFLEAMSFVARYCSLYSQSGATFNALFATLSCASQSSCLCRSTKHEVVGEDASFNLDLYDTVPYAQTLGLGCHFEQFQ